VSAVEPPTERSLLLDAVVLFERILRDDAIPRETIEVWKSLVLKLLYPKPPN
jgi:hypothetical protein